MSRNQTVNYRFLLPQVKKEPVGNQGEVAQFIPYRLEEGVTEESIRQELEAQPHMEPLLRSLDPGRKIYLLESASMEVLELAAEYIGTYHRLANNDADCYESVDEEECEEKSDWRDGGDKGFRSVDFSEKMPCLEIWDLNQFYSSDGGFGFGNRMYLPEHRAQARPWWTLSLSAPIAVTNAMRSGPGTANCPMGGGLAWFPEMVHNLSGRELILLLCLKSKESDCEFGGMFGEEKFTMEDLSFELETDVIRLEPPKPKSRYKKDVLCQLTRERGTPLSRPSDAAKILSMVEDRRGDVDNATLSKVVSNALFRRKGAGPLAMKDFNYLSTVFVSRKRMHKEKKTMELVGQQDVRAQLEQIVAGMAFQSRRRKLGLPTSDIHYTFAFLGAPGTGKTTWARWLGEEMRKRDLLDNTDSICINAAELKAQYVGHTTAKVHALFERYGIIILDEAYSLTEGKNGDSFGAEALSQLCVELENHGSDRLVVFAGYGGASDPSDNRMLCFLQSNPGINSRISFKIHFQNFQAPELVEVLRTMLSFEGYRLPEGADRQAEDFFRSQLNRRAFGNCREVRNLADRIKLRVAARLTDVKDCTRETACQVILEDVEGAISEIVREFHGLDKNEGRSIGFS